MPGITDSFGPVSVSQIPVNWFLNLSSELTVRRLQCETIDRLLWICKFVFGPLDLSPIFHVEANVCTAILPRTLSAGHTVVFTSWCIALQDGDFEIEILFSIVSGNCTRGHVHPDAVPGR